MKNFKKVLALVLVVAMMASFAVTASATDFTDDSAINNQEAVSVMTLLEVINGKTDGSFDPAGNVTRAEMAKMITTILNKGKDVNTMYAASNKFVDCGTHWAAGYISYAAAKEIVNGVGSGKFDPNGLVTGAQAAKMVLGMIGYNAENEGYTGAKWDVPTVADADRLGLLAGLEDVVMDAPLNRENAAQMLFNALDNTVLYFNEDGINIDSTDLSLTTKGTYTVAKNSKDEVLDVQDVYFAKLTEITTTDAFGAPATKYTYNKESVTHAKAAEFTFVAEKAYADEATFRNAIYDEVGKDTYTYNTGKAMYAFNGVKGNDFDENDIKVGDVVSFYVDAEDEITTVVVVRYAFATITSVVEDKKDDDTDARKVKTDKGDLTPDATVDFDAIYAAAEKDAKILVAGTVAAQYPTSEEGRITATKGQEMTFNGTKYTAVAYVTPALTAKDAEDVVVYFDANGFVVGFENVTGEGNDNAAVVTDVYKTLDEDGKIVDMAKAVFSDGVEKAVKVDAASVALDAKTMYNYEEEDGVYTFSAFEDATAAAEDVVMHAGDDVTIADGAKKIDSSYFASDVTFIYVNDDAEVTVYDEVTAGAGIVYYVLDADLRIDSVFVIGTADGETVDAAGLVYVTGADTGVIMVNDTEYKTGEAYIDGKLVEDFYTTNTIAAGVFEATINDDGAYTMTAYVDTNEDVKVVTGEFPEIAADKYVSFEGAADMDITDAVVVDTNETEITSVADLKDAETAVTATVIYDAEAGTVLYIYVTAIA